MSEFVKHDAGYVVPFEDTKTMADRVYVLYRDPKERACRGTVACQRVRSKHDVSVVGKQILQVLQRFAEKGGFRSQTSSGKSQESILGATDLKIELRARQAELRRKDEKLGQLVAERDRLMQALEQLRNTSAVQEEQSAEQIQALSAERDGLRSKVSTLQHTLTNIYSSHGWKALEKYYRLRNGVFPWNSKRREAMRTVWNVMQSAVKGIRLWSKRG
jgi:hypothetical protein